MTRRVPRHVTTVLAIIVLAVGTACARRHAQSTRGGGFTVTSADMGHGDTINAEQVYRGDGCTGANVSPALTWNGAPVNTRSFAITEFDPDAPTGHGWWHWLVYDIPVNVMVLPAGAGDSSMHRLPAGATQGRNDFGGLGYGGPCPPPGKPHHYHVAVYALDVPALGLSPGADGPTVEHALAGHTIAIAEIVALYGR